MIAGPQVEERTEQPYVAIRTQVTMQDFGPTIPQLHGEVFAWLSKQGVAPAGAPFIRYLVIDMETQLDVEMGVPVASAVAGDGRIHAGVLLAGRYATLLYTGDYSGLMGANAAAPRLGHVGRGTR